MSKNCLRCIVLMLQYLQHHEIGIHQWRGLQQLKVMYAFVYAYSFKSFIIYTVNVKLKTPIHIESPNCHRKYKEPFDCELCLLSIYFWNISLRGRLHIKVITNSNNNNEFEHTILTSYSNYAVHFTFRIPNGKFFVFSDLCRRKVQSL